MALFAAVVEESGMCFKFGPESLICDLSGPVGHFIVCNVPFHRSKRFSCEMWTTPKHWGQILNQFTTVCLIKCEQI